MSQSCCLTCDNISLSYFCKNCINKVHKCDCDRIVTDDCDFCKTILEKKSIIELNTLYDNTLESFLKYTSMIKNKEDLTNAPISFIRQDGQRFTLEVPKSILTLSFCKLLLSDIIHCSPTNIIFVKHNKRVINPTDLFEGAVHLLIRE